MPHAYIHVESVRSDDALVGLVAASDGNQISALVFLRRGGELFRSCQVREEVSGGHTAPPRWSRTPRGS
jgi:hypothetical protein